jgi:aminopeptidase N
MNPKLKSLLLLSAIIGLVVGSPIDFEHYESEIAPAAELAADYRLTREVVPDSYEVYLKAYFEEAGANAFTFDGEVKIRVRATTSTPVMSVVLHSNDLIVKSYSFDHDDLGNLGSGINGTYNATTDKLTLTANQRIPLDGKTTLTITYQGFMRDDMNGFYRSYYMENNQKVWMASTQFQQTEARRAFPCFDVRKFLICCNVFKI